MQVRKAILGDIEFIKKLYWESNLSDIQKIELDKVVRELISSESQKSFIIDYLWERFWIMIMNERIDIKKRWKILRFIDLRIVDPSLPVWKEILSWASIYAKEMDYLSLEILSDISKNKSHEFYKKEGFEMTEYWFSKKVNKKVEHI